MGAASPHYAFISHGSLIVFFLIPQRDVPAPKERARGGHKRFPRTQLFWGQDTTSRALVSRGAAAASFYLSPPPSCPSLGVPSDRVRVSSFLPTSKPIGTPQTPLLLPASLPAPRCCLRGQPRFPSGCLWDGGGGDTSPRGRSPWLLRGSGHACGRQDHQMTSTSRAVGRGSPAAVPHPCPAQQRTSLGSVSVLPADEPAPGGGRRPLWIELLAPRGGGRVEGWRPASFLAMQTAHTHARCLSPPSPSPWHLGTFWQGAPKLMEQIHCQSPGSLGMSLGGLPRPPGDLPALLGR